LILPHNFGGQASFDAMIPYGSLRSFKRIPTEHLSVCSVLVKTPGILWDGRISACGCLDHKGTLMIGNIQSMTLGEARKSRTFRAIVEAFRAGDLHGVPLCASCDVPYGRTDSVELSASAANAAASS
jgi:hypothetical protein